MHYYLVQTADMGYQKNEALTYASDQALNKGDLVLVPFGRKTVPGFVRSETAKPGFETKSVKQLLGTQPLPAPLLELFNWMQDYYPGGSGALASAFVPTGLEVKPRSQEKAFKAISTKPLEPLTKQQSEALEQIRNKPGQSFLLHGETGSGKTRIYIERARAQLEAGSSALILTPEISLVPQLAESFRSQFGNQVVIMHSGLTKATRNRNWLRIISSAEPLVVVGARSALFAPINHLGLIVVDEMHEPAYKQESTPYYHAMRVAGTLARLHEAEIIYGSATPPVVEYFIASNIGSPILRLSETARPSLPVKRSLVDLKDPKLFSRHRYLSDKLLKAIGQRLGSNEQVLLFLNRRGTARQVNCENCGWQALCPKCDLPLIYHADKHHLRCHTCGYRNSPPLNCPVCSSDQIAYRSLGTKALVDDLNRLFPDALIRRFDTDNLAAEKLDLHFEDVQAGKVDVLVGTQMLGKGLDLPKLGLVGIINADTGLGLPDFSAAERSYQLLHQAIGRVGRGHLKGEVIVQSFNTESPLLLSALNQDWQGMYDLEVKEREQYNFPPFCYLLKVTVSRKTASAAERFADKLYNNILALGLKVEVSEPVPSFYERTRGKYNWQLVIRARRRDRLVEIANRLPKGDYVCDLDPINLL